MDGSSLDITKDKLEQLKQIIPEAFTEEKIDLEKLKLTLGENVNISNERYVLNWAGKSDAFKVLQQQTTYTLEPQKNESINFDTSENIFIEGENLEVLKVLQKSYFGKIKMIYIDPPYNTGNDSFIYPDKFSETKDEYLKRIGEKNEEGYLTREGFFRKNSKENGQYHSNWLSMMYPRLYLARNLLRDDGVIFVSIDDNEVHNLKMIMNEIFGEENFISTLIWKSRQNVDSRNQSNVSNDHEYLLVYGKSLRGREINIDKYKNPDKDRRGSWMSNSILGLATASQRPNLHYEIIDPMTGNKFSPPADTGWRYSKSTMQEKIRDNRIIFPEKTDGRPREKKFLSELDSNLTGFSSILSTELGFTLNGTRELRELLTGNYFPFPKPIALLKELINQGTNDKEENIVLDFFAGSGTTAHAVLELNKEDIGNRRFILVQFQEKIEEDTEANQAGYKTIAEICRTRIKKVINKIEMEKKEKPNIFENNNLDLGFKAFKLRPSNFKIWRGDIIENGEELDKMIDIFANPINANSEEENILYELLIKSGYELTTPVEIMQTSSQQPIYYSINKGQMVIVLKAIDQSIIDEIIKTKPQKCIILDKLFEGNDQLKTNTVLQMKDEGIEFRTI